MRKGLVVLKGVRIVTPGTVTDEALLSERRDTLLLAVARGKNGYGLAWADLAGGRFLVNEVSGDDALEAELARLDPPALLLADEDGWTPVVSRRGRGGRGASQPEERPGGEGSRAKGRCRWAGDD